MACAVGRAVARAGRRGLPARAPSNDVARRPSAPVSFEIVSFVSDDRLYADLLASFGAMGFREPIARFVRLRDRTAPEGTDPFDFIRGVGLRLNRPYVVLVHQDVRLDRGAGVDELVEALADLDDRDARWVVAGTAGGTESLGVIRRVRDPHGEDTDDELPARVVTLDEHFLVFNRTQTPSVSPGLFGFHFYGSDVALNARLAGGGAYVLDFPLTHLSRGRQGEEYAAARDRFVAVWQARFRFALVRAPTEILVLARQPILRRLLGSSRVREWVWEWGRE